MQLPSRYAEPLVGEISLLVSPSGIRVISLWLGKHPSISLTAALDQRLVVIPKVDGSVSLAERSSHFVLGESSICATVAQLV